MFETGIRQFRMAMAMVWGRRLDVANLGRLVEDAVATLAEFGEPGSDAELLTGNAAPDPAVAVSALRRTARRLAACCPFYARRFAAAAVRPGRLDHAALRTIPVTTKNDLVERPNDFRCTDVTAFLATRTTGTTGRPAEIWLSRYEMELWPALGALASVLRGELQPGDVMQVNLSSRATAAMHLAAGACRLVGAAYRPVGIVAPDTSVDGLCEGGVTVLSTCPSYLGELVTAARRRGLSPTDFRLRRVTVGGEVLSPSLAAAACRTFGVPRIEDTYSMTEVIPVTGRTCSQHHVHYDVTTGMVELLDLDTGEPAAPGALGTLVVTPFFPYRDCMPVFRYDTRDVARRPPEQTLTCELAQVPATGPILGKADHLLRLGSRIITPRQLIDAVESLPTQPWPARYRADVRDGRIRLVLPERAVAGYGAQAARRHLAVAGLDVDVTVVDDELAAALRPTRSDLRETVFAGTAHQ